MKSKKIGLLLLMAIMVCFLAVMPVSAEVIELWNRTYDSGYSDFANGVATDISENVIVTGYSDGDYYTIKYDKDGNVLWNRTYDNNVAHGVATDASENVIVTGSDYDGSFNYYTIKYDKDGNVLWSRSYDSGYYDIAEGVATDASENVIVTGGSSDGSTDNYYTIKYGKVGNVLWSRSYDSGDRDYATGVATDISENVIVTGYSNYGSSFDNYYTIKYDKDGNELWSRSYDGGSSDFAHGVATDISENVIVTGESFDGSSDNYYTIKYDKDGNELWNRTYDSGSSDFAHGVATDISENVIVTGESFDGSSDNYYTIKYDKDGNELWNRSYDGGFSDWARGVATDISENVIVTGGSSDGSTFNYYTIKYGGALPVSVSITTDKTIYSPSDTMTITIDIANPTEDIVTFQWYWGVPQYSIWVLVMSNPIPAGYDDTLDFSFTILNWGPTPFGNVFYVQLLDANDEVLDADRACWAYSPSGKAMPQVDIAEEIKKTVERAELPS